jgi:hypothetical protein
VFFLIFQAVKDAMHFDGNIVAGWSIDGVIAMWVKAPIRKTDKGAPYGGNR